MEISRPEGYYQAIFAMIDYNNLKDSISKRTGSVHMYAYLGIRPNNCLPRLVHNQNSKRESKRNTPEFRRNRGGPENVLQARSVQIGDPNERRAQHPHWNGEVATWSPKWVGVENGNAPVADREETAVLHEHYCDITAGMNRSGFTSLFSIDMGEHLLDALAHSDEMCQLVDRESLEPVFPFIIHKDHIVEPETLLRHVEEPHAHCARPHHQAYELSEG